MEQPQGLWLHAQPLLAAIPPEQAHHASQMQHEVILGGRGFLLHNFLSAAECKAIIQASEHAGYDFKASGNRFASSSGGNISLAGLLGIGELYRNLLPRRH
jgi:hypothetical protein